VAERKRKKGAAKASKDKPRKDKLIEGVLRGKTPAKAARDAGFSESYARVNVYRELAKASVQERIAARQAEAKVETNEIIGTLASQMRADLADILPKDEIMQRAKEAGVSHLIKKLRIKTRFISNGPGKKPDKEVTHEIEMYSAQEAAKQLCSVFGLNKKEGENPIDEQERVERAIETYITRTGASRAEAIKNLIPFLPEVSKYAN
jgi:hypothetical protein